MRYLFLALFALMGLSTHAHATLICSDCEKIDGVVGTYLGTYDPLSADYGTFRHTDLADDVGQSSTFDDFWVFDLSNVGLIEIAASVFQDASINNFRGSLHLDAGATNCASAPSAPSTCSIINFFVTPLASGSGNSWGFNFDSLNTGRYILRVQGVTPPEGRAAYAGEINVSVPAPATFALFGLGLAGLGWSRRNKA